LWAAQAAITSNGTSFPRCYGPEYISSTLMIRGFDAGHRPQPHTARKAPARHAYVERYNRTVLHEWLDLYIFETIEEAQEIATDGLWTYE